ncbi:MULTISPECIES: hypothetical protein [Methanosarcina]|uniref:hypothetical protein n=1 Tax=Methanosarcina TaxID=2207 RepID=UPI00064EAE2D|nr:MULTISPECIES: hypothetical protein [Methanosarcina]
MIESSLAVPTFVQYLQTLQYSIFPSELTFNLAWHFGHIFSRFVTNPPWISIFKTARSGGQKPWNRKDILTVHKEPERISSSTEKLTDPNLEFHLKAVFDL